MIDGGKVWRIARDIAFVAEVKYGQESIYTGTMGNSHGSEMISYHSEPNLPKQKQKKRE